MSTISARFLRSSNHSNKKRWTKALMMNHTNLEYRYSKKLDSVVVTRDLHIITGIGIHSRNGKGVLRPHMNWYLSNAPDPPLHSDVIQDGGILMVRSSDLQRWVWKGANLDPWLDRNFHNYEGRRLYSQRHNNNTRETA